MSRPFLNVTLVLIVGLSATLFAIGIALGTSSVQAADTSSVSGQPGANEPILRPGSISATTAPTLSCREGYATPSWQSYLSEIDLTQLNGGIYLDFSARNPYGLASMEFIQVIRVRQSKDSNGNYLSSYTVTPSLSDAVDGLGPVIVSNPGSLWLIGNEPDRGPNPGGAPSGQDDTYPDMYARIYHDVYEFIKQRDPSAQVGIAGLVEVTPGRLQYLDKVLATYEALYARPIPVDVWNMHLYVLPEEPGIANVALGTDPTLAYGYDVDCNKPNRYCYADHDDLTEFDRQVRWMRQWMKDHGQRDKPLLLSEFGLLYDEGVTDETGRNFTPARAATFLTRTFDYLASATDANIGMPHDGNRLVQQWVWFSLIHPDSVIGSVSDLVAATTPPTFTQVGQMFRANTTLRPIQANLVSRLTTTAALLLPIGQSSVTAMLSAEVVNNGNSLVTLPLTVTFYSDAALTQVIGSSMITPGVPGCARRGRPVSVPWSNRGVGVHTYWVKVDSSNSVPESSESDNATSGQVFVGRYGVYLPMLQQRSP